MKPLTTCFLTVSGFHLDRMMHLGGKSFLKKRLGVFVNITPVTVINYVGAWPRNLLSQGPHIYTLTPPPLHLQAFLCASCFAESHSKNIIPHHCQIQEEVSLSWWRGSNSLLSNFTSRCSVDLWLNLSILPVNIPHHRWNNFTEMVDKRVTCVLLWNVWSVLTRHFEKKTFLLPQCIILLTMRAKCGKSELWKTLNTAPFLELCSLSEQVDAEQLLWNLWFHASG